MLRGMWIWWTQIGGPAYRIGMGGGAASSMVSSFNMSFMIIGNEKECVQDT